MSKSSHETAGRFGMEGEKSLLSFFEVAGFKTLPDEYSISHTRKKFSPDRPAENLQLLKKLRAGEAIYVTQVLVCRNIYGTPWRADIFAYCPQRFPNGLIVESKRQTVAGSVDEKLPFVVLSMNKADHHDCLLSILGGGMRQVSTNWARDNSAKHVMVALTESDVRKYLKDPRVKKEQTLGHTNKQDKLI